MLLSLRKSLQELFVVSDGYSVSPYSNEEEFMPTWSSDLIYSLEQDRFKKLCAGYFEEKCYSTKINDSNDLKHAHVMLFKESYSSTKPFGIIKCWETKAIHVEHKDLSEFTTYLAENNFPLNVFITAGKISDDVFKLRDKKIRLIDGNKLLMLIKALPEIRKQRLLFKLSGNG